MFWTVTLSILQGCSQAVKLFFLTLLFALPLGLVVAFGSMSRCKPLSGAVKTFVWVIRGTPLMLQMFAIYFAPYYVFGISLTPDSKWTACVVAFIINYAAYFSEIFRGGIDFRYARRRGISSHDYTLLMAAKSLYCHTAEVTQGGLAEPQIIPDEAFRLLINALLIARFGLDALKITARRGQRGYTLRRIIRREAGGNAPSAGLLFPSEGR